MEVLDFLVAQGFGRQDGGGDPHAAAVISLHATGEKRQIDIDPTVHPWCRGVRQAE